ncbi:MAG: DUF2937 family protein [Solimonas sp.]
MNVFLGLIDRLLFVAAFIVALQLPQFVDHYTQRYGGYHQALADSMAEYRRNADEHYGGDLDQLIADLESAPSAGIHDIGRKLAADRAKETEMRHGLDILEKGSLVDKLWYLSRHLDREIALGTWLAFTPGLPLSSEALICGLAGALLVCGLFNLLRWLLGIPFRRRAARADLSLRVP